MYDVICNKISYYLETDSSGANLGVESEEYPVFRLVSTSKVVLVPYLQDGFRADYFTNAGQNDAQRRIWRCRVSIVI